MIPGFVAQQALMTEPAVIYATLSPGYKDPKIALSNGNLTATHSGTNNTWGHCSMFSAKAAGKWYCEVTVNYVSGSDFGVAVGNHKAPLSLDYLGHTINSIMHTVDGRILIGNANIDNIGAYVAGDVICIALDADAGTVRFRKNGGTWRGPYTLDGGGPHQLMIQMYKTGDTATVNFGATPFTYTPYAGHVGWEENTPLTSARYWRYHVIWGDVTGNVSLAEIELRTISGGPDQCTGGTASQLSTFSSPTYTADKAVDDDYGTMAHCANFSSNGWWWQYDFGTPKTIVEAALTMRNDLVQYPREYRLLWSNDGTNFYAVIARNDDVYVQGQTKIFNFNDPLTPPIQERASDEYYYNVGFQIGARGKADGASYTADDSRYANAVVLNGNAAIAKQKFTFDGAGDYIYHNNANSAIFTPGHKTSWEMFAVEFNTTSGTQVLFANYRADNGGHGWRIYYDGGALKVDVATANNATVTTPLSYTWAPLTNGTRYDILLTWDRSVFRLYINGIYAASGAYTNNIAQTDNVGISVGCDFGTSNTARNFFNGKMVAARLTCGVDRASGSTTTYVRDALPLTKTQAALDDALWGNVTLLLHGEGADGTQVFRDRSPIDRRLAAFGAAQSDTAISVGDTPSILLGTNADYIEGNYGTDIDLLGKDFCFEAMVKHTDAAAWQLLLSRRGATSHNFYFGINAGKFRWDYFSGSGAVGTVTGATTLSLNTLYHLCAIRDIASNTLYLFVNGVLDGSAVYSGTRTESTQTLAIGHDYANSARYLRGSINHIRMTVGAKRYNTAGFTVPSVPYPIS